MRLATGAQSSSALFLICVLVGCGKSGGYETTPVKGVATYQSQPIANATINFTPLIEEGRAKGERGRLALGTTDGEGKFELTTYENYDGAIIGRHTVTISLNMDEATQRIRKSEVEGKSLEVIVEKGKKEYKIEF